MLSQLALGLMTVSLQYSHFFLKYLLWTLHSLPGYDKCLISCVQSLVCVIHILVIPTPYATSFYLLCRMSKPLSWKTNYSNQLHNLNAWEQKVYRVWFPRHGWHSELVLIFKYRSGFSIRVIYQCLQFCRISKIFRQNDDISVGNFWWSPWRHFRQNGGISISGFRWWIKHMQCVLVYWFSWQFTNNYWCEQNMISLSIWKHSKLNNFTPYLQSCCKGDVFSLFNYPTEPWLWFMISLIKRGTRCTYYSGIDDWRFC